MNSLVQRRWVMIAASAAAAMLVPVWLLMPGDDPGEGASLLLAVTRIDARPAPAIGAAIAALPFSSLRSPELAAAAPEAMSDNANGAAAPTAVVPRVVGLISRQGGKAVALVVGSDGTTRLVASGDDVDGWQVVGLGKNSVTFERGGERQVAELDYSNKAGGAAPPAGTTQP